MENKEIIKVFLEKHNITKKQFLGKEKFEGDLHLSRLTTIPNGFNPTVGGSLYLSGNLKCHTKKYDLNLIDWFTKPYIKSDGIFTEVLHKRGNVYKVKKIANDKIFYFVTNGKFNAHGNTLKKAKSDLEFKIIREKLKKEPINKDTIITINYYRLITGACELGVKSWMQQNNIKEGLKAIDLLPILEKTNAYGYNKFKQLINF